MNGDEADRLKQLEDRIETFKRAQQPAPPEQTHYSKVSLGWRMVTELVAGLLIGLSIGYGADIVFGTLPIFTVLFMFAGFAAGVKTMIATSKELMGDEDVAAGHSPGESPGETKKEG